MAPPTEKWRATSQGTGELAWARRDGHAGSEKWRFHLASASLFRQVGQWRRNRTKRGSGTSEVLPLVGKWPRWTLLPAVTTCLPLKWLTMLSTWVSSESLSRTNQRTSLVSKWRVRSTTEERDYFLIPHPREGSPTTWRNWGSVPSFKVRNCTPVTWKPHSSTWKLISFQCFPSGCFPCQLETLFGPHARNKVTWSLMLPRAVSLLESKLPSGEKPVSQKHTFK